MYWRNGRLSEPVLALPGKTWLQFRVILTGDDTDLKARLESQGMQWQPEEHCYLSESAPIDFHEAIDAMDLMAQLLSVAPPNQVPTPTPAFLPPQPAISFGPAQSELIQRYETCLVQRKYSPKTLKNYKNAFRMFLMDLAPVLPQSLCKSDVTQWLAQRMASKQSSTAHQNTLINAIKFYYTQVEDHAAAEWEFKRPKQSNPSPGTLTKAEVQGMLLKTTNVKHRCLMLITYATGLRLKEVLSLRGKDIHRDRMTITVQASLQGADRRSKTAREVPLSPKLLEVLNQYFAECNPQVWLFEGERRGQPYSERSAQMVVTQAAERAGIKRPVSIHMLRNSYATHQLEAGIAMEAVQDLMGHGSIRTTGRYAHVARRKMPASPADDMQF